MANNISTKTIIKVQTGMEVSYNCAGNCIADTSIAVSIEIDHGTDFAGKESIKAQIRSLVEQALQKHF